VRPADEDAARYAAMYTQQYVRLHLPGTAAGNFFEAQRRAVLAEGGYELLGLAVDLIRQAAVLDRGGGRFVISHLGRPMSPIEIVGMTGQPVPRTPAGAAKAEAILNALANAGVMRCDPWTGAAGLASPAAAAPPAQQAPSKDRAASPDQTPPRDPDQPGEREEASSPAAEGDSASDLRPRQQAGRAAIGQPAEFRDGTGRTGQRPPAGQAPLDAAAGESAAGKKAAQGEGESPQVAAAGSAGEAGGDAPSGGPSGGRLDDPPGDDKPPGAGPPGAGGPRRGTIAAVAPEQEQEQEKAQALRPAKAAAAQPERRSGGMSDRRSIPREGRQEQEQAAEGQGERPGQAAAADEADWGFLVAPRAVDVSDEIAAGWGVAPDPSRPPTGTGTGEAATASSSPATPSHPDWGGRPAGGTAGDGGGAGIAAEQQASGDAGEDGQACRGQAGDAAQVEKPPTGTGTGEAGTRERSARPAQPDCQGREGQVINEPDAVLWARVREIYPVTCGEVLADRRGHKFAGTVYAMLFENEANGTAGVMANRVRHAKRECAAFASLWATAAVTLDEGWLQWLAEKCVGKALAIADRMEEARRGRGKAIDSPGAVLMAFARQHLQEATTLRAEALKAAAAMEVKPCQG
jgi:hypothetical protein